MCQRAKSGEAKLLRVLGLQRAPSCPYPLHLLCSELLVFLLGARCSLRKLPKMVAWGLVPAEGSGGAQGGAASLAPPRRLLQLAVTRVTNSRVVATGLEQPPRGKGSRAKASPRAGDTSV